MNPPCGVSTWVVAWQRSTSYRLAPVRALHGVALRLRRPYAAAEGSRRTTRRTPIKNKNRTPPAVLVLAQVLVLVLAPVLVTYQHKDD